MAFLLSGCLTGRSKQTADGREVPGRQLFEIKSFQNRCEPIAGTNLKQIEEILNQYGKNGWELGGFITQNGNLVGFCVKK